MFNSTNQYYLIPIERFMDIEIIDYRHLRNTDNGPDFAFKRDDRFTLIENINELKTGDIIKITHKIEFCANMFCEVSQLILDTESVVVKQKYIFKFYNFHIEKVR